MNIDFARILDFMSAGYSSLIANAKIAIRQNNAIGYVIVAVVAMLIVLIFISQCFLLRKARIGWGWNFVPIIRDYAHTKMTRMTFAFWSTLVVSAAAIVLLVLSKVNITVDSSNYLILRDFNGNILYDYAKNISQPLPATYSIGMVLMCLACLMNLIYYIVYCVKLSMCFGHGGFYGLGVILLPEIFLPILAFGKSEYRAVE